MSDERDQVMIFRQTPRRLDSGCIHCGKSRQACDARQYMRSGECCCWRCETADRDPH